MVLSEQTGDLDFAFDNEVKAVAGVSFLEDVAARFVGFDLGSLFQGLQFGGEQSTEQLAGFENNHARSLSGMCAR